MLLLASVPIAFIFQRLRLPTIVGFMITGVLIGPHALGLINDVHAIEVLAEIGVALLLFTIGLEFSLRRMLEMKRLVLLGGGLQIILTTLLVTGIANLLGRPPNEAIFFGFLFALSSTAIVLKSYIDRAEIDAPHGRAPPRLQHGAGMQRPGCDPLLPFRPRVSPARRADGTDPAAT